MFRLKIDTKNAAFDPEPVVEIQRILNQLLEELETHKEGFIFDSNGNNVGSYKLTR